MNADRAGLDFSPHVLGEREEEAKELQRRVMREQVLLAMGAWVRRDHRTPLRAHMHTHARTGTCAGMPAYVR
jgi:hypothetical protein